MSTVNSVSGQSSTGTATSALPAAGGQQLSKETFLTLLVAQIKNQNPLNPADGVQFLSQLAQFSQLEETMSIRTELEGLHQQLTPATTGRANTGGQEHQAVTPAA